MADAAKPKRRLPFKPTALRQKSDPKPALKDNGDENDDDDDDGLNLFKRSAEFFPVAVAEQERRMKRKQAEREKGSQARSPDVETKPTPKASEEPGRRDEDSGEPGTPPSKRSRTSDESPQSRVKLSPTKRRDGTETPSKRMTRAAASRTPRKQEVIPTKPVISIDDSDDDPDEEDGGRPEDDDDDDIYEASPIRKFNRRRQTSEPAVSPPLVIDVDSRSAEGGHSEDDPAPPQEEDDDEFKEYVQRAMERKKALEQEANQIINVLVTSDIPGTKERQFRFTLVKPLKILRNAWIDVQEGRLGIPRADLESVFLTWRGHELYDLTTLHSLDLAVTFRRSGGGSDADAGEGFRNDWTNVHMQMWTRELWEEHERQEARRRRRDIGEYSDDEGSGNGGNERRGISPAVEQGAEKKIKVLLKTKTDEPLKTSVRPSTTVGTIMALFRKMRGLAADAPISLMFDGDELEEDMTVEDADIGDMETIEVYIR
ncbi:Protein ESC2 [Colletotrichum shisoi]|uniref:Protein ESC2 n=1 Tax=Colletotrichum shisoi TaxID=2078593 RepID=A0A5Q4C452_9PEZI|nr:Protein ESC2 [Colletotrichum shisoi]